MNEIVKYDNYMNGLRFKGFTTIDYNFLMVLCNKLRDKETSEIIISFDELREKTGYKQTSIDKFVTDLERMNEKLMKITCRLKTESKIIMFVLFPTFEINLDNKLLTVSVNQKFKFILNELVKNFTRFELNEFVRLDSKYSKSLYRLLKQYRTTGRYEVAVEDFKSKMDIPTSYTNRDIMSKIINMSLLELKNHFQNLKCEPKYARKRGKPVSGYIFTFKPEQPPKRSATPTDAEPLAAGTQSKPQRNYNQSKAKNQFKQFNQREVTQEEMDALEKKLLS